MRGTIIVSTRLLFAIAVFFMFSVFIMPTREAYAGCSCASAASINSNVNSNHSTTRQQVCDCYNSRMDDHEQWILDEFWPLLEEALKGSASQQTQGQATQLQAQSVMHDANNHVATQRERETQTVETIRRYGGAEYAVCTPASIGQGAIASREIARGYASALSEGEIKNGTGATDGRSPNGSADDRLKRFGVACQTYISASAYGGLGQVLGCSGDSETRDLDVLFTQMISGGDTNDDGKIDGDDFFDGTMDKAEETEAFSAFKSNLGLSRPFPNIRKDKASSNSTAVIQVIMAKRQYEARRAVAASAFHQYESIRMPGSAAPVEYLRGLYTEMGRDAVEKLIPENPSYYTQMKAIFHDYHMDPNLYVQDFTDSPEQMLRHIAVGTSQINAQLFRISELLEQINMGIAGNTMATLEDEYGRISSAVNSINTSR